jgi:hypothetical protein
VGACGLFSLAKWSFAGFRLSYKNGGTAMVLAADIAVKTVRWMQGRRYASKRFY